MCTRWIYLPFLPVPQDRRLDLCQTIEDVLSVLQKLVSTGNEKRTHIKYQVADVENELVGTVRRFRGMSSEGTAHTDGPSRNAYRAITMSRSSIHNIRDIGGRCLCDVAKTIVRVPCSYYDKRSIRLEKEPTYAQNVVPKRKEKLKLRLRIM